MVYLDYDSDSYSSDFDETNNPFCTNKESIVLINFKIIIKILA